MSNQNLITERGWECLKKAYRLTPKELQLAKLILAGFNNEEAAASMCISSNTVYSHQQKLFAKVRSRSRTELALTFIREALDTKITQ